MKNFFQPLDPNDDPSNDILQPDKLTGGSEQYLDFTNDPSGEISKTIAENPLSSPYFDRIKQLEQRRQILSGMPDRDQNGRARSGLKALVEGIGTYFDPKFGLVRNWGEFGARIAAAGGRALGGVINPSWDEKADREKEIAKIDEEQSHLVELGQKDWQMRSQAATFGLNQQKEQNRQNEAKNREVERSRQISLGEAKFAFQKLNAAQQNLLKIIGKQEYYTPGEDKNLDKALSDAQMVIPAFDSRPPITREQAGKYQQWDYTSRTWGDAKGMPVDESEVPIEFSINGTRMKLRPRDIAGIEAAKERQQSQQNFQATEAEKIRSFQERMKSITNENDAVTQVNQAIKDGQKRIADGDLTKEQYRAGIQTLINMFAEPIRSTLLQRFNKEVN